MSFFVDRFNRRKSPIVLAAFGAAVLFLLIFAVAYALLAGPLYRAVSLSSAVATNALHSFLISIVGTAVCCLLFLLKDKRVVPYGFAGLAVALCMFYIAALLLEGYARSNMIYLITAYGLFPVLVGNTAAWPIYLRLKRANPGMNRRKTMAEELREAVAQENAKHPPAEEKKPEPKEVPSASPAADALFGPQADRNPMVSCSSQEEAMLFYEDDDDAQAGND